ECGVTAQLNKPARSSALLETLVSAMQSARAARMQRDGEIPVPAAVTPIRRVAPAPAPETRILPSKSRGSRPALDVLIAEDNEVNQLVFSQILDGLGLSYRIASNGRTAVELHRTLRPSVVLMDVPMPEMNGLEATRAIRDTEAGTGHR